MVNQFLDYLRLERNYSPLTVKSYAKDLEEFEAYYKNLEGQTLDWKAVDADLIRDWMESMMDRGNTATSINRRLSALRSFYRFALKNHLVQTDPAHAVVGPKRKKPLPVFVKDKEMEALLDPRMWTDSYEDILARTILIMFYETGMRLSELVGLDVTAVSFVNRELKVTGKRNKQRMIPFGEELTEVLKTYIEKRESLPDIQSDALFLTKKGNRMSRRAVQSMVSKQLSRVTTLKKKSPHVLRHTFATTMLNHGAGLESVKKLLGHESLSTTEIYTHTTFEQLKKVYEAAHPRAGQ